jgi:hypothetical protein
MTHLLTLSQAARKIGCTKRALHYGCSKHELSFVWSENKYNKLVDLNEAQLWWTRQKHAGGRPRGKKT